MTPIKNKSELIARLGGAAAPSSDFDLDITPSQALAEDVILRPAGVLVPVFEYRNVPHLILTKRASHLRHHPGQISFPGGRVEPDDTSAEDAALREASEEIGLDRKNVEILSSLSPHRTVTNFEMKPVLGWVSDVSDLVPEPNEVSEIFYAPLNDVLNPERFSVQSRRWRGERRYYYTVPWGPYYIWGATARILKALSDRVIEHAP